MIIKEYPYHKGSWQYIITEVKKILEIDTLTKEQASLIMSLYLKATPLDKMIKQLEETK
ncbi:hypothetical protein [Pseudomonas phage vB_PsaM_M1]|nr:hypothetical protein [Pseudomonas phage vB_PsaM_M1]